MPRVKIDYIVSFSNEDPENQASNLLAWDVSKKKWLCSKGEPSCSVVLQLAKSVKISAVHVGAYHAALVEVLVGRSEKPNEPFQVLVPSSVFLSPSDSRREENVERVRSFSDKQLSDMQHQRWDRLRLVCSQPYNKHCKYGLSFVQVYEPEGASRPAPPPTPPAPPPLALDTRSSDEDDFKPGELFAKHSQEMKTDEKHAENYSSTGAQIRRATARALQNVPSAAAGLVRAPVPRAPPPARRGEERGGEDRKTSPEGRGSGTEGAGTGEAEPRAARARLPPPPPPPHELMRGVVLVLSGYENPRRARVRQAALAMGAACRPDWGPGCTHLVCAFPNTPKLRRVRAAAGGARVPAATAEWVEQTAARGRPLPPEWFATEPERRVAPPPPPPPPRDELGEAEAEDAPVDSECDTDDEIEKVLHERKKRRVASPGGRGAEARPADVSRDSDVTFVRDERIKGTITVEESDDERTEEEGEAPEEPPPPRRALPAFYSGCTFLLRAPPGPARALARYVRAYGGLVLEEEADDVDYVVCAGDTGTEGRQGTGGKRRVRAQWVWRCHAAGRRLPLGDDALE